MQVSSPWSATLTSSFAENLNWIQKKTWDWTQDTIKLLSLGPWKAQVYRIVGHHDDPHDTHTYFNIFQDLRAQQWLGRTQLKDTNCRSLEKLLLSSPRRVNAPVDEPDNDLHRWGPVRELNTNKWPSDDKGLPAHTPLVAISQQTSLTSIDTEHPMQLIIFPSLLFVSCRARLDNFNIYNLNVFISQWSALCEGQLWERID